MVALRGVGVSLALAGLVCLGFFAIGRAIARPGALYYKGTQGRAYRYSILVSFVAIGLGVVMTLVGVVF